MKKILLLSALLCAISIKLFAQTSSGPGKISIGVDAGLPIGNASNYYSVGVGADLKYSYPVASNVSISLSAGFTEFIGKDFIYNYSSPNFSETIGGRANNLSIVPVKAGIRYSLYGTTGFFGEAQFGAAFVNQGVGTSFVYAPAVGYAFNGGLEAGVRFEGITKSGGSLNQLALRLAYNFQ